jgi:hypothetical protein
MEAVVSTRPELLFLLEFWWWESESAVLSRAPRREIKATLQAVSNWI